MITGGCLCGRVRYECEGAPLFALNCHCRDCQRVSGAGHASVLGVEKAHFLVEGETRAYATTGESGRRSVRHFCPTCGSTLFGTPEAAPWVVTIYAGSLDDPSVFEPTVAQFTRSRPDWDRCAAPLREFSAAPPAVRTVD